MTFAVGNQTSNWTIAISCAGKSNERFERGGGHIQLIHRTKTGFAVAHCGTV